MDPNYQKGMAQGFEDATREVIKTLRETANNLEENLSNILRGSK